MCSTAKSRTIRALRIASPHRSVALYDAGRELGEMSKRSNLECVACIRSQGREVDTRIKSIEIEKVNGEIIPKLKIITAEGIEEL